MTQNPKTSLKKSNIPWIGEIPEYWDVVRIKNICDIQKTEVGKESYKYSLLSLTLQGIKYRDIESGFGKFPAEFDTYQIVDEGDLIFCLFDIEETPRTIGLSDKHGMITGAYTVVKMKSGISNAYYYYLFLSADIEKRLKIYYSGLRNTIKDDNFRAIPVPLPPLPTQTAIANFLDQKTTEIKKFIENKRKLIELLKEQKQSIIHRAVTKGIDPNAKMKESGIPWIGEVPEDWKTTKLKFLLNHLTDGSHISVKSISEGHPYVTVANIDEQNGKIDLVNCQKISADDFAILVGNGCKPKIGDILFSQIGTIGLTVEVTEDDNFVMLSSLAILSPDNDIVDTQFLILYLKSSVIKEQYQLKMDGGAVKRITLNHIANFNITLPSLEIQKSIAKYIKQEISQIDSAIAKIEQEIALIEEYQTSLIYQAVTGKISIS